MSGSTYLNLRSRYRDRRARRSASHWSRLYSRGRGGRAWQSWTRGVERECTWHCQLLVLTGRVEQADLRLLLERFVLQSSQTPVCGHLIERPYASERCGKVCGWPSHMTTTRARRVAAVSRRRPTAATQCNDGDCARCVLHIDIGALHARVQIAAASTSTCRRISYMRGHGRFARGVSCVLYTLA